MNLICFEGDKTIGLGLPWVPNLTGIKAKYRRIPWATASACSATHALYVSPNELHVSGVSYATIEGVQTETWHDLASAVRFARQCWGSNKGPETYPT